MHSTSITNTNNDLQHKESKQVDSQSFSHQKLLMGNLPMFSSAKHPHYMVLTCIHIFYCIAPYTETLQLYQQ